TTSGLVNRACTKALQAKSDSERSRRASFEGGTRNGKKRTTSMPFSWVTRRQPPSYPLWTWFSGWCGAGAITVTRQPLSRKRSAAAVRRLLAAFVSGQKCGARMVRRGLVLMASTGGPSGDDLDDLLRGVTVAVQLFVAASRADRRQDGPGDRRALDGRAEAVPA